MMGMGKSICLDKRLGNWSVAMATISSKSSTFELIWSKESKDMHDFDNSNYIKRNNNNNSRTGRQMKKF